MGTCSNPKARCGGARRAGTVPRTGMTLIGLLAGVSSSAMAADPSAEVVYQNGTVYTVDQTGTVAQALAISGGKIAYVGSNAGAQSLIGKNTKVIDLAGRTVMPGLIDGHMHPAAAGRVLLKCNLSYASLTVAQFRARIQSCLDERGTVP